MDGESRDHLLRSAWELFSFEGRVPALSEISRADRPGSPPPVAAAGRIALHVEEPRRRSPPCLLGTRRRGDDAAGKGRPSRRAPSPARPRPPTAAGLRPRLRNQRQDDHRVDDRRDSARSTASTSIHNRAGSNMRTGASRPAMLEQPGEIGVFEVDEAWLPIVAMELDPPCDRARESLPGPTRQLRRARCPGRRPGRRCSPARSGRRSSSTRTMPWSPAWVDRRRERPAPDLLLRRRGSRSGPARDRAHGRLDPLPRLRRAARVRCPAPEPPWSLSLRRLRRRRGRRPQSAPTQVVFDGLSGSSFSIDGGGRRARSRPGLPGLYNVYNALAATGAGLALGVAPASIAPALEAFAPVFGRGERLRAGATTLLVLLMKNPAGANELLRTLSRDAAPTTWTS